MGKFGWRHFNTCNVEFCFDNDAMCFIQVGNFDRFTRNNIAIHDSSWRDISLLVNFQRQTNTIRIARADPGRKFKGKKPPLRDRGLGGRRGNEWSSLCRRGSGRKIFGRGRSGRASPGSAGERDENQHHRRRDQRENFLGREKYPVHETNIG